MHGAHMALNTGNLGGSARFLNRMMGNLSPRKMKTPVPRATRNMAGSMGATRNPRARMSGLRSFGRYT